MSKILEWTVNVIQPKLRDTKLEGIECPECGYANNTAWFCLRDDEKKVRIRCDHCLAVLEVVAKIQVEK
jgi:DNA-directed RNA polymerase subunit RPC12/RpoP